MNRIENLLNHMLILGIITLLVGVNLTSVAGAEEKTAPAVDGKIANGEYSSNKSFDDGNYLLYWRIDDDVITFAIKAKTTGWAAVGLDPEKDMLNSDIIMCTVDSKGKTVVDDMYSTGEYGPHPPDTELEGKYSIIESAGNESDGWTIVEFSRKLNTGDSKDKVIAKGKKNEVMWAYGGSDDNTSYHTKRGHTSITLYP